MGELVGTREQLLFGKWSYDEVEVRLHHVYVHTSVLWLCFRASARVESRGADEGARNALLACKLHE